MGAHLLSYIYTSIGFVLKARYNQVAQFDILGNVLFIFLRL